jgi:poly-gamma-glutamate synthesis protein (capsule biosynthesis protein)
MHPDNVACLTAAKVDCCALANNHVLDWGTRGLVETLDTLRLAGIKSAGAGFDLLQAEQAAVLPVVGGTRVLVYSLGMQSSGIPPDWSAQAARAGVYLVDELAEQHLERLSANIRAAKQLGDIVVASIHWGSNWGYDVSASEVRFAHRLIGEAGVDVVHGHSSHHPKAIEVHARKLILYGCGDFINDYEGIHGHDRFRPELTLMYFPALEPASGQLLKLELVPVRMRRFRCQRASEEEVSWLCKVLQREGRGWHTHFRLHSDQRIELEAG